jgi:predicted aspartyl protease
MSCASHQLRSAIGAVLLAVAPSLAVAQAAPTKVTVPLIVEYNRPFIEVTFTRKDGSLRKARFLLDTGGGAVTIGDSLAKDVGIEIGRTFQAEGHTIGLVKTMPVVSVGGFPLILPEGRVGVSIGSNNILPTTPVPQHAEGMIPALVLSKYHVVFDYPRRQFTIANAGVLTPAGSAMPMPLGPVGYPRTEVTIGDSTYGLLIDTGAAFTMVSDVLLKSLGAAHPAWKRFDGGEGEAAWLGGQTIETLYVPAATWNGFALADAGVTSQRAGVFERGMSSQMASPIIGSLAGNVLRNFRVELDYPNRRLYLSK